MEVSSVVVLHLTPDPTYALVDFQDLVFSWIWAQVYLIVCFLTLLFIFVVVSLTFIVIVVCNLLAIHTMLITINCPLIALRCAFTFYTFFYICIHIVNIVVDKVFVKG